ncbi:PatB family C-S lyase [Granulosicoccaceae sp. 1_MG-2023]|nr:PatB family C-S lyase [Granulosicoccaceae sp. 1_MG-2023]
MSDRFETGPDRRGTGSLKWDKYKGRDVLPLWVADMDFAVAEPIIDVMRARLEHPVLGYTIATEKTSQVVCDMLRREYNWEVQPEWLVWIPGVVPGLWAACAAVGEDGEEALFNTPIYHHFYHVPGKARKQAVGVALQEDENGRWSYDMAALQSAITDKSRLMMLCHPHNPTGTAFTAEETAAVCRLAADKGMTIVSDEIHCGLMLTESRPHVPAAMACPEAAERMITLMSPSKTFNLAGLDCAFAVIPDARLRRAFSAAGKSVLPMVAGPGYTALEVAYTDVCKPWHEKLLATLRANYAYLYDEINRIDGLRMGPMEATYLAWINTAEVPHDNVQGLFEEFGAGLSGGAEFGLSDYVRLNFACPMPVLEEAVARIRKAIASL